MLQLRMVADTANIVMESWYNVKKRWFLLGICICVMLTGCGNVEQEATEAREPATNIETAVSVAELEVTQAPSLTEFPSPTQEPTATPIPGAYDFTVCFAGDISLAEGAVTTQRMDASENGIYDCISAELMDYMNQADIFCLNNEFTYSLRGEPLAGKAYTFRANPERVAVLGQMGVDVVSLANNHVYDYGEDALLDTLDILAEADISYFGAGTNLEEAMKPIYKEVDGKTIAFVGASRAEKNKMTPQAGEDTPGILRCYDTELFRQVIKEADANADFVLAYVHWGTEYSHELEDVQLQTGKEYLDAGADVIIGAHSHCLQGMEYYDGKPIIYSLGNYWFNKRTLDTMLLMLHFQGNDVEEQLEVKVIPAIQAEQQTRIVEDSQERERIFSFLEEISVNVEINEVGVVTSQ
ncbi:MAG: CapA family protein [Lachnospiraceae bacterium]|nr:CapA family protein [Lachnospiraceae bacterium]